MAEQTETKPLWPLSLAQWVGILLIVLAIAFIAQNLRDVSIDLLWLTMSAPLWFVLAAIALVGFIAGNLIGRRRSRRR